MRDRTDPRVHPWMNVAFYSDHYFWLCKTARQRSGAGRLALVPLAVDLGKRVNVVRYRIGVQHFKVLSHLNAEHSRIEPASLLINRNRIGGGLEFFILQTLF